jgi:hypothetical protein
MSDNHVEILSIAIVSAEKNTSSLKKYHNLFNDFLII